MVVLETNSLFLVLCAVRLSLEVVAAKLKQFMIRKVIDIKQCMSGGNGENF